MLLAGCSKDADISNSTLSGNGEKTPLLINATLDTGKGLTRAVDGSFEDGDVLYAYVRHMVDEDGSGTNYSPLTPTTDYANKTVTITKTNSGFSTDSYWDDFSNSASDATNIRTTTPQMHGLQAYYGYCYNGRLDSETPAPLLTEDTGVLIWSVLQDQSTDTKYKRSDLLKAPQTATVNYSHSSGQSEDHGTLQLAFSHAMSQITVTVNAGTGFSTSQKPLKSTVITLKNMFTKTQITGPNGNWVDVEGDDNVNHKDITMYAKTCDESSLTRDFVAVVAPGTELRVGAQLMNITDVHGNNYIVEITSEMIAVDKWATVAGDILNDGANYIKTKPGYNYNLTVTVMKSSIQASATLTSWTDVSSTGTGAIDFPNNDTNLVMDDAGITQDQDVQVATISENKFKGNSTFSLFWLVAGTGNTNNDGTPKESSTRTNGSYEFVTQMTFQDNNGSDDTWTYAPVFYWPNRTDKYYFRALAKYNGTELVDDHYADNISLVNDGNNATKDVVVSQSTGPDIVWGTTAHHWGKTAPVKEYNRSYAIAPRTGGVPIVFEHVMSKITFALETTTADDNKKVNLEGATIAISNLYTQGKINLDDGSMNFSPYSITNDAIPATTSISGLFVVPQTFADNTIVTIVLPNEPSAGGNATYTIKLKELTDGSTAITQWEKGKNYTYTIHVDKEQVKVNALVKEWEGVVGSGTATLTW